MDQRRRHSPLQQLENEGIHSRGLNENDMGRNSLEWLSHPNFPQNSRLPRADDRE